MSISAVGGPQSPPPVITPPSQSQPSASTIQKSSSDNIASSEVAGSNRVGKPTEEKKESAPSATQVHQAMDALQKAVAPHAQELTFSVDKETGISVIKITDTTTDTVVRQIPSKEALEMAKDLEKSQGLLLNQKV